MPDGQTVFKALQKSFGQMINFQKSSIMFSPNVQAARRESLYFFLQVDETFNHGKYLGLPSLISHNKYQVFSFVEDKAWARIQNWNKKFWSRAGKEILLKIVVQALLAYVMSVFLLPKGLCLKLERIMNAFWWGKGHNGGGKKWKSWDKLCVHKSNGGLGFRRLYDFNLAVVAKQGWRMLLVPNSLMAKVYKARYFPNDHFLNAKIGHNPSYMWSSVVAAIGLIRYNVRRHVGDGK